MTAKQQQWQLQSTTNLQNLPKDIIHQILSLLPAKSLLCLFPVSTAFPPLISSPDFLNLHLSSSTTSGHHLILYYESTDYTHQNYSLLSSTSLQQILPLTRPFESLHGYLRIVGSSKGVICFFDTNYYAYIGRVILWNPSINKFKLIQDSHLGFQFPHSFSHLIVGFGFVPKILDFKVVQILFDLDKEVEPIAIVYCLGKGLWQKIDSLVPCYVPKSWSSSVFVNGSVNWLAYKRSKVSNLFDCVMEFDMIDECFRVIELPEGRGVGYNQVHLSSSKGGELLCLCFHFNDVGGDRWDLWEMGEYGVVGSWRRMYNIVQPTISLPPLSIRGDGGVLFVINHGRLVLFDINKEQIKDLQVDGLPSSFQMVDYTSSLALLNG